MKNHEGRVHEYTAFFEANEHGGYTVTVPALPGLVTEGKGLEHARRTAKDAVRCYIEGLKKAKKPVPVEGEVAQLRLGRCAPNTPAPARHAEKGAQGPTTDRVLPPSSD